jgi:hypothetical protein
MKDDDDLLATIGTIAAGLFVFMVALLMVGNWLGSWMLG